jgi:hypothetical protein
MGDKGDNPRARRRGLARDWRPVFLKTMGQCANVTLSCRAAGISRKTAYQHRERDERFAEQWADAFDDAVDRLELEARRRAVDGTERPVFYKGVKVGSYREYSDNLLMFLLRAYRPEKFRENYDLTKLVEQYRAAVAGKVANGRIVG